LTISIIIVFLTLCADTQFQGISSSEAWNTGGGKIGDFRFADNLSSLRTLLLSLFSNSTTKPALH